MRIRLILDALCVCGLVASSSAGPVLSERLPAGTLLYVGWAGRSLTFDGSQVGQLLDEPGVAEVFAGIKKLLGGQLRGTQGELFENAWAISAIAWQHPMAIALTDLKGGAGGPPQPSVALLIDLGRDRDDFGTHLDPMVKSIADDETRIAEATVGQITYKTIRGARGRPDISFGFMENVFFATVGPETAGTLIKLTPEKSLASQEKFIGHWKAVGGQNEQLAFYVNMARLVDRVDSISSGLAGRATPQTQGVSRVRKIIDALGVGKVEALAGSTRIVDRGMYTKVRLFTPAPHRGLLMPLAGAALTEADLSGVPQDADFVCAMRLSPEALWAEIRRVARRMDPKVEDELLRQVANIEKDLGVSISEEVLSSLGDTIVLAGAPSQGGFLTGSLLSITVKDPAKLSAALAKIEAFFARQLGGTSGAGQAGFWTCSMHPQIRLSGPGQCPICQMDLVAMPQRRMGRARGARIETIKVARTEIRYLAGSIGIPLPVAPAWAIHKDKLYVAAWPQVIASAIQNDGRGRPITGEENFQKARSRISPKASALFYVNTPKILRQTYHALLVGWTLGANAITGNTPVSAKPAWLPSLATLEKHIWPEISGITADEGGITFEGYGSLPAGGAALMPLASPLSLVTLLPALNRSRHLAKRVSSAANLNGIGKATALYAAENRDQYPPDLAALVTEGFVSTRMLVSPLSGRPPPKFVDGRLIGEVDYIYIKLPAEPPADAGELILAYERPELHRGEGANVLFADFHVEFVSTPRFERALKRTMAYVKAPKSGAEDF